MIKTDDFHKNLLKNAEYKKEYEDLKEEFEIASAIIGARAVAKITQEQLAKRMKIKQSQVARLESGSNNITVKTLQRIAKATGMQLIITFGENKDYINSIAKNMKEILDLAHDTKIGLSVTVGKNKINKDSIDSIKKNMKEIILLIHELASTNHEIKDILEFDDEILFNSKINHIQGKFMMQYYLKCMAKKFIDSKFIPEVQKKKRTMNKS